MNNKTTCSLKIINTMIKPISSVIIFIMEMRHLSISQWDLEDKEFSAYSKKTRQQR